MTAPRAPLTKYPPAEGLPPQPIVRPPVSVPKVIPLPTLSTPPPPTFLKVLAQRDICECDTYTRYVNNPQPQNLVNVSVPVFIPPILDLQVYTLHSNINPTPNINTPRPQYKLAVPSSPATYPVVLHTNFHLLPQSSLPNPSSSTRILSYARVIIPLATPYGLLIPPTSQSPNTNPTTQGDNTDPHTDVPPKNRLTGPPVPQTLFTGLGQGYTVTSALTPSSLILTLNPLISPGPNNAPAQQIPNNPDLSFVIEGVRVNTREAGEQMDVSAHPVFTEEHYSSWDKGEGKMGVAAGEIMVPLYAVNAES